MKKDPIILAIDTSCDETSVSVLHGFSVLSNLLPSQAAMHRKWGGVVPSLAKLAHQEKIDGVVNRALKLAGIIIENIDLVAVTYGPGLAIALEVGIKKAKQIAEQYSKPLFAVNHMEGHLYSAFAEKKSQKTAERKINYPVLGVLVSGGHSEFVLVDNFGNYRIIGETLDDACGEAFDKCGRLLGLGYPAGPAISNFSRERKKEIKKKFGLKTLQEYISFKKDNQSFVAVLTNPETNKVFELPIPMANSKDFNLSYSGLKSAFSRLVSENELTKDFVVDMCVLFESVAIKQITLKIEKILEKHNINEIWLGGGVVASSYLKAEVRKVFRNGKVRFPYTKKLTGDNAAMIGVVANLKYKTYGTEHNPEYGIFTKDFETLDRDPSLSF